MNSRDRRRIVVIGSGFSGTMVTAHLLQAEEPLEITLIERGERFAKGVAYGTTDPTHLLNVPAGNMSAFPKQPDHFVRWLEKTGAEGFTNSSFVPRFLYGRYLESVLDYAKATERNAAHFNQLNEEVIAVEKFSEGFLVTLGSKTSVLVDKIILALGNFPAAAPAPMPSGIAPADPVLIVGTGLTMVDTVLGLKEKKHTGKIYAISRHGLLPQKFEKASPYSAFLTADASGSINKLFSLLRKEVAKAISSGTNWQSVFSALRPISSEIWQTLPDAHRARFLRHLKSYWDTRRHQMPPEVADKIRGWREDGSLEIIAARKLSATTFRRRGSDKVESLDVRHVIDCTGVDGNFAKMTHPLIRSLREQGFVVPDAHGLGIATASNGAVLDAKGNVSDSLFAIGSLRRGELWESTAVPELRVQAERLAADLTTGERITTSSKRAG